MKGLVRKVLIPLTIAGTLFATNPVFAEEKEKKDFNPAIFASGGIGFFRGNDKEIRNIYGIDTFNNNNIPKIDGSIGYDLSKHLRLKGDFSLVANNGEPNVIATNDKIRLEGILFYLEEPYKMENIQINNKNNWISFQQLAGIIEYLIPIQGKNFTPIFYIGLGPSIIHYHEKIFMRFTPDNSEPKMTSEKFNGLTIGLAGELGIEFLSKRKKDFYDILYPYVQLSGNYANVKGDLGKINMGGLSIESGFRFRFEPKELKKR
jgi:hypothetical protein